MAVFVITYSVLCETFREVIFFWKAVNDVSLQQARALHFTGVLLPSKRTCDSNLNVGRAVPPCFITLQVI